MGRSMRVYPGWFGFILVLLICAIACSPAQTVSPPRPAAPVVTQPATAVPAQDTSKQPAMTGEVIFQDDFKGPNSGWTVFTNDFGEGKYEAGGYVLKAIRPTYPEYEAYTINSNLTALTSFMLDMDVTMLAGGRDDSFGIILRWPDINKTGGDGTVQPSYYYFKLLPEAQGAASYSQLEVKGTTAETAPGWFLHTKQYACVKGINSVNNIKIRFNPNVSYLVNDYEFFDQPDETIDYVNRLVKEGAMKGGTLEFGVNTENPYSTPSFKINRIAVYANN